jgi:hypothetical protein
LERLEAEIVELATQLTSATARLVLMIGEFDEAEGWREWGMRSTAHWLSWKCGVGMNAGREQVRVARALRGLPLVTAAFAEGRLSYSKVRAVTRFATVGNEADVVAIAECATAAQMEQLQAGMRRARTGEEVRKRHAARGVRYHYDDDGSLVGTFRLPPEDAARFLQGLDVARGRVAGLAGAGEDVSAETSCAARTAADALVLMADRVVADASAETSSPVDDRFQLVLHSTVEALARPDDADDTDDVTGPHTELADGTRLHPSTARRLTCDCPTSTMIDGADGDILHVGRRTRRIRGRLLRAVHARDRGRCRAPGCTERASQIHHVRHWANGGPTCLPNLISLCDGHHWLVHEGGFMLVPRRPGQWALLSPAGVTIDTPPPPPAVAPLAADQALTPDAVSGHWDGHRLDLNTTVSALTPPTRPTPAPQQSTSQEPAPKESAPDPTRTTIPWEICARWLEKKDEMRARARTSGHIIVITDDDC